MNGNIGPVRVRFAPSPTGYLHIGGARTALFNWLFARHHQGKLILRVEDTDRARSKKVYLDQILEDLRWLGLDWDEGPYFQSKQLKVYQEYAQKLLAQQKAYRQGRAVILKAGARGYEFVDVVRGAIKFEAGSFKDQVLLKSDGTPTYNFACCLDDYQMRISHVIRGDDHISNTPKQLAIYEALGMRTPVFAHIPLIVAEDRSRLSKRKGALPISFYKQQGYLPEALVNFLALLGWSLGANQEIAPRQEIIRQFRLERVLKTAAFFNPQKLEWMNGEYIHNLDTEDLLQRIVPYLKQKKDYQSPELKKALELLKPRIKKLCDFPEAADFLLNEKIQLNKEIRAFLRQEAKTKSLLKKLSAVLSALQAFDQETVEAACRNLIAEEGIKAGQLIHPVRAALTGKRVGPGLFETMAALGKERSLARLGQAIKLL